MRSITATEAKQNLAALIDAAQREPVVVRRHDRDVAVVMSPQEYDRLRGANVEEFLRLCNEVAERAAARGLTPEILDEILKEDNAPASGA